MAHRIIWGFVLLFGLGAGRVLAQQRGQYLPDQSWVDDEAREHQSGIWICRSHR